MFTKTYGRGERTVLALHGWGGDHREFAAVAARLPPDVRLVSVDLPGYGASPPPACWTREAVLTPLRALLDTLPAPVTVTGFCSGAVWAFNLALYRPDTVGRLVLIDPLARVPGYFRLFTWGSFGRHAYQTTFHSRTGRAVTDFVLRRRQRTQANFTASMRAIDPEVTLGYLRMYRGMDDLVGPARVDMKVDLCRGEHTFRAVKRTVDQLAGLWPQATVHTLRGVGHLPMIQGAAQIRRVLWPGEPRARPGGS